MKSFPYHSVISLGQMLLWFFAGMTWSPAQDNLPIVVQADKTFSRNLFAYKQDIRVEGVVEGHLVCIGGNIYIEGKVEGNINVVNGSVTLFKRAEVTGNIVSVGGQVHRLDGARLNGRVREFFSPAARERAPNPHTTKTKFAFFFGQTLFLFLLVIFTFYLFPNQINEASFELTQDLIRHFVKGVLALALFMFFLFMSFLLTVIGIGMVLFLLFFAGMLVMATFGSVAIFYRLGQFLETQSRGALSLVPAILLAVFGWGLLLYVPLLGVLAAAAFVILGVGLVIDTRFGTNKQWFTRKPQYWSAD